jgi:excisionase family DNA binding protein
MELRTIELLTEIKGLIKDKVSDRWLCIREVCEYVSISESTIRRAVRKGSLKASQSTGKLLFKISSVDRWLNG